jgi:hypothetical protein
VKFCVTLAAGTAGAALRYQITKSTTADFKHYDYLVVAKTATHIYFIPTKIQGTMKTTMVPNPDKTPEHYPLSGINQSVQDSTTDSVTVRFILNNGEEKVVQFYDNLGMWIEHQ